MTDEELGRTMKIQTLLRATNYRKLWRAIIAHVTNGRDRKKKNSFS